MKINKKNHFVFDLDDTITNSYKFNQQMFVDTFKPYVDTSAKAIDRYLRELHYRSKGTSMNLQFEEAVDYLKLRLNPKKLVDENENLHIENIHKITVFDYTHEVLKFLKNKGETISICTNRQQESANIALENNKILELIDNVISCTGHEKPDPYFLKKLIKSSEVPKNETILFGDSSTDAEFASNAGIDYIIFDQYINNSKFFLMLLNIFS